MFLKNLFLQVFNAKPRLVYMSPSGGEATTEQKAEALSTTLETLTNQQIINLTSRLDGKVALSDTEIKILTKLGILQGLDEAKRKSKFSGDTQGLINSPEFDEFLKALQKNPDLYSSYEKLVARTESTTTESVEARDRLRTVIEEELQKNKAKERTEAVDIKYQREQTETRHEQEVLSSLDAKSQEDLKKLSKQKFEVPAVLCTGNAREWADHFQSLDTGGKGLQTAEQILRAEPFNWKLEDFRQVLQRGGFLGIGSHKKIRFHDIIKFGNLQGVTAQSGKEFMEEYAQMKNPDYLKAEKAEFKDKSEKYNETYDKAESVRRISIDTSGLKAQRKTKVDELLTRTSGETLDEWKQRISNEKLKAEGKYKTYTEKDRELNKPAIAIMENAIRQIGDIQAGLAKAKEEKDAAKAKIQEGQAKKNRYEKIITKSLDLFDALSRLQEGEKQVDVVTSSMELDAYSKPEQHAINLTYQAFSGEELDVTQTDLEAGTAEENIGNSTALTRLMSFQTARERLIEKHSKFEGEAGSQRRVIDHKALTADLKKLMMDGLYNFEEMQPPIDLIDVVESLGIEVGDAFKTEIRKMRRELNQVSKAERKLSEKSKTTEEDKQELARLKKQRETLAKQVDDRTRALITLIENNPKFKNFSDELTDIQKRFIQFGMYQRELTERGIETAKDRKTTEDKLGNLETRYRDNPIVLAVLQEIQRQKPDISSEELETIVQSVQSQLDNGFNIETHPADLDKQGPGGQTADSRMLGGLSFITKEGKGLTAAIPTINIKLDSGASLQLSLIISSDSPIPIPAIGGTIQAIDTEKVDMRLSMQISGISAAASSVISLGRPDRLNFYIGGGGSITLGMTGWHVGAGLYMSPQGTLENHRETEMMKAGDLLGIDALPRKEKIAAIRALPQFEHDIEMLKNGNPPITDDKIINEILLTKFEHLKQEVGTNADADVFIFPIRGAGVALINPLELARNLGIPIPKGWDLPVTIPVVFVTLAFKGQTKIMPFIDRENQLPFLTEKTDTEIGEALMRTMGRKTDELVGQVAADLEETVMTSRGLQVGDSGQLELDGSTGRQTITTQLGRSIEDYNEAFKGSGITFGESPTYKGKTYQEILHIQFAKNRFLGTVKLRVDDQTNPKIHVLRGSPENPSKPATLDDLYLSFDRMDGRLIIETREIQLARPDRFGNTIQTIIVIKTNPHRSRADIERDDTGYLLFAHDKSVVERKESEAAENNNILTWEEAERLGVLGQISEMDTPIEYTRKINAARARMEAAISGPKESEPREEFNTSELDKFAKKHMEEDSRDFKTLSTMIIGPDGTLKEANRPALVKKLQKLAKADPDINRKLTETEINYTINRLIVLSFHQHRNQEALKRTVERFFRPKLAKLFEATEAVTDQATAESFANTIISAIDFDSLDLETGRSVKEIDSDTYMLTIVGTEGIEGLRGMINLGSEKANVIVRTGNIIERIPAAQRATYRAAMLEMSSKLQEKPHEFLRSPLALKLADYAPVLLGPDHSDKLAELYTLTNNIESFNALLANPDYARVYGKFQELVTKFRDMQIKDSEYMLWENMDGYAFAIKDMTEYSVGVHKKCANPSLLVHEDFAIARLHGRIDTAEAEAIQRADYKSGTHIYELFAALAMEEKQPPKPKPEEEKPKPPLQWKGTGGKPGITDDRGSTPLSQRGKEGPLDELGGGPTSGTEPPPE